MSSASTDAVNLIARLIADLRRRMDAEHTSRTALEARIKALEGTSGINGAPSDDQAITTAEIDAVIQAIYGEESDADAQQKS